MRIETERLRLRTWEDADRDDFAALNADPIVMGDLGGPLDRGDSDSKFERYLEAYKSKPLWPLAGRDHRRRIPGILRCHACPGRSSDRFA